MKLHKKTCECEGRSWVADKNGLPVPCKSEDVLELSRMLYNRLGSPRDMETCLERLASTDEPLTKSQEVLVKKWREAGKDIPW